MNEFLFGDIVVVDENRIGVIVKSFQDLKTGTYNYDVYVREYNGIKNYEESEVERYRVRHKYLDREELLYQKGLK